MILSIDTTTNVCSAALLNGELSVECYQIENGNHIQMLPNYIQKLIIFAHKNNITIDAIALSMGPGSYTGLRIGTAMAKGLSYSMNIPLLAISTLKLLSFQAISKCKEKAIYIPMIDARRMEVYTACYSSELECLISDHSKIIDDNSFSDILNNSKVYFFGNGSTKCRDIIKHPNAEFIDDIVPLASYMGKLSNEALLKKDFVNIAYFAPFYLKEFQATISHKSQDVLYKKN